MSIPTGTPSGAIAVGFENPAGTVMAEAGDRRQNSIAVCLIKLGSGYDEALLQRIDQCIEPMLRQQRNQLVARARVAQQPQMVIQLLYAAL
jgi:hypothetical protein